MSPDIINKIFKLKEINHYNLRHPSQFILRSVRSVYNGTESVSYSGPETWEMISSEIKNIESFSSFKPKIKTWKPSNCLYPEYSFP